MDIVEELNVGGPVFFKNDAYVYGDLIGQGSLFLPYVAKTAAYTAGNGDYVINATSGTFTVTLPTAVGISGKIFVIKNSGTGTVTVDPAGSETIDSVSTAVLPSRNGSVMIQSDGSNWIILACISPVRLV